MLEMTGLALLAPIVASAFSASVMLVFTAKKRKKRANLKSKDALNLVNSSAYQEISNRISRNSSSKMFEPEISQRVLDDIRRRSYGRY